MTLQEFAKQHSLTTKNDSCGDAVIAGRPRNLKRAEDRNNIYEHSDTRLGLAIAYNGVSRWFNASKKAVAAGFTVHQAGTNEGNLLFDPTDKHQAKVAISLCGCRERKPLSPEKAKALGARLLAGRQASAGRSETV